MQSRIVSALVAFVLGAGGIAAGQAGAPAQGGRGGGRGAQDTLVSPEVHPDRTVTFRIRFPQATTVTLTGDWLATPATPTGGTVPLTKDADGVWSVTTEPLEPTVHLYFFTVDGLAIADPINPRMKLRVRTSASLVEVPGSPVPPWQVRDIPHGSVDWNVQHSTAYNDTHEFLVYLPPGYFQSTARYPVLYLVHGAGDTAMGWSDRRRGEPDPRQPDRREEGGADDRRDAVQRQQQPGGRERRRTRRASCQPAGAPRRPRRSKTTC